MPDRGKLAERVELDAPAFNDALAECGQRYAVEWTIFPLNPWVVRDLTSGKAVPQNERGHFAHFATPEAADRARIKLEKQSK